jgi:LacI family transcriptional regulator
MTRHGQPTLRAVADEAGVSVATVSKVLNGRFDVAAATRARVRDLLDAHGYVPTPHRAPGSRWLVDLVLPPLDSPYALEVLRGVTAGPLDVVVRSAGDEDLGPSWVEGLRRSGRSGAIVVVPELSELERDVLRSAPQPCVVVDPTEAPDATLPAVGATNRDGGRAATQHLLELGHRRVAVVTGPRQVLCSRERVEGHREALRRAGITPDPGLEVAGDFHHAGGLAAGRRLLRLADPPTAVFAGSDEQALGVVDAAREQGLRVPDDLSVVGFDDLPTARWSSPALTTVRQPLAEMGRRAAGLLRSLLEGGRPEHPHLELPTELRVRSSTAPPPSPARPSRRGAALAAA